MSGGHSCGGTNGFQEGGDSMWLTWLLFASLATALVASLFWVTRESRKRHRDAAFLVQARHSFRRRREWLEAEFVSVASETQSKHPFEWKDCEFENEVSFARERTSSQLRALVGITVALRAETNFGSFGSDNDASAGGDHGLDGLRAATAVFRFDGEHWYTDGRAVFNLTPQETILHFQHELEVVE